MPKTRSLFVLVTIVLALFLAGCASGGAGGGDGDPISKDNSPEEAVQKAKETLDKTSGLSVRLESSGLPSGQMGVNSAEGVGVHPAAFKGTVNAAISGFTADVGVVAVDGKVYLAIGGSSYAEEDPARYNAPDPAVLMATEGGASDLLTEASGLKMGEEVRGGADNSEILTEYSGTLPGASVARIIPTASGDSFKVTYLISGSAELREVKMVGEFYKGAEDMTYTISFSDYGKYTEKDVTAP